MKIRTASSLLAGMAITWGIVATAGAEPRPERPLPPGARPAPPLGQRPPRPLPPVGQRPAPEAAAHHETVEQIRARLQQREEADRKRREAERKDPKAWEASREQRGDDWRNQITSTWGQKTLERPEARAELSTHADRMARLNRILDIAQDKGDTSLATHAKTVIQREIARDTRVLQALQAKGDAS